MSAAEFESLVALFLEGNASAEQVARLRTALSASPALRARFQASARLHQAQLACLSHREERSMAGVMTCRLATLSKRLLSNSSLASVASRWVARHVELCRPTV